MIYVFKNFELNTERSELRRDGMVRHLEPQVFSLIELLVSNNHRIVTKDEINDIVWNGRIVSEAVVNSRIRSARIALDDSGHDQRIIKTHSRKGFRVLCEVSLVRNAIPAKVIASEFAQHSLAAEDKMGKPSLAVFLFGHDIVDSMFLYASLFLLLSENQPEVSEPELGAAMYPGYKLS